MYNNFAQKSFNFWLKQNRRYFDHSPILLARNRNYSIYAFHRINNCIRLFVGKTGNLELRVYYRGLFWDILTDFDIYEERDNKGRYFCRLCDRDHEVYYRSRHELWVEHSFKPLFEWSQENLHETNRLYLFGSSNNNFTSAHIWSVDLLHNKSSDFERYSNDTVLYVVLPLVVHGVVL